MKAGTWGGKNVPNDVVSMFIALAGAGASAPTVPANGDSPPSFPTIANVPLSRVTAEAPARSGVGVYTCTLDDKYKAKQFLCMSVDIIGTAGLWGQVSNYNATTRVITFRTFAAGGAATDLAVGDLAVISINMRDSSG